MKAVAVRAAAMPEKLLSPVLRKKAIARLAAINATKKTTATAPNAIQPRRELTQFKTSPQAPLQRSWRGVTQIEQTLQAVHSYVAAFFMGQAEVLLLGCCCVALLYAL